MIKSINNFLIIFLCFSSLNLKYLKLTKVDITRFAMKLFTCQSKLQISKFKVLGSHPYSPVNNTKMWELHTVETQLVANLKNGNRFWKPKWQMKSFIAKRVISILVNLRFKLLKYKENNTNFFNTFDHNFKNIPLYIMSNVSIERYYFVLYDGALTLKMSKMALNAFCDKTLQIQKFQCLLWCSDPREHDTKMSKYTICCQFE